MEKVKKLARRWIIDAFTGMAQGLFVTLIAGLIFKQIGRLIGDNVVGNLFVIIGNVASMLTGAGIGVGIARKLGADNLVLLCAAVAGTVGANCAKIITLDYQFIAQALENGSIVIGAGDPIGAYLVSLIAIETAMLISGKTKLNIILVPLTMLAVTLIVTVTLCPPVIWLFKIIGEFIQSATQLQPLLMGIVIAVVVGILLTMPTSSAAICISIGISGIAGGAAVVGCCCHMVGFAVQSFKDNRWSGLIAQGIGTSMLQIPNVFRKPLIMVPPIVASAICGALSTTVFKLECDAAGSGMGTSGLVGVFTTITSSVGHIGTTALVLGIILLMFVIPAIVCVLLTWLFRKKGWIVDGDMKI